jgi:hypothetical protein
MLFGPHAALHLRSTTLLRCRVLPGYTATFVQTPSEHASFVLLAQRSMRWPAALGRA